MDLDLTLVRFSHNGMSLHGWSWSFSAKE